MEEGLGVISVNDYEGKVHKSIYHDYKTKIGDSWANHLVCAHVRDHIFIPVCSKKNENRFDVRKTKQALGEMDSGKTQFWVQFDNMSA